MAFRYSLVTKIVQRRSWAHVIYFNTTNYLIMHGSQLCSMAAWNVVCADQQRGRSRIVCISSYQTDARLAQAYVWVSRIVRHASVVSLYLLLDSLFSDTYTYTFIHNVSSKDDTQFPTSRIQGMVQTDDVSSCIVVIELGAWLSSYIGDAKFGRHVGTDELGNRYFENMNPSQEVPGMSIFMRLEGA